MTDQNTGEEETLSFNLVRDPWIPVLMRSGDTETLSLTQVFQRAPEISQVVGDLPTTTAAIEGVLQAIFRRTVPEYRSGNKNAALSAVARFWEDWEPAARLAEEYLEQWSERFELVRGPTRFFQVADLEKLKGGHDGLEALIADAPGNDAFLTMRRREKLESISFPEAARWLVHAQAYDPSGIRGAAVGDRRATGGKVYPTGPGWAALFGVISPRSGFLSKDLLLAAAPSGVGRLSYRADRDLPAWEREPSTSTPEGIGARTWETASVKEIRDFRRQPNGPADVMTWQSRRIRLVTEGDTVVGVVLAAGDPIEPQDRYTVEPRAAWRFSMPQTRKFKKTVYMPRELPTSSSLWRGLEALFPTSVNMEQVKRGEETPKFYGPAITSWVATLDENGVLGAERHALTFQATGMTLGSNRSVVDNIVSDSLSLPVALFEESKVRFRVEIQDWIDRAEQVSSAVAGFAADLARAAGAEDTDGLFQETRADFLAIVHPLFLEALAEINVSDLAATMRVGEEWSSTIRAAAFAQQTELLESFGDAAAVGTKVGDRYINAGRADRWFRQRLGKILGYPDQTTEEGSTEEDHE